MRRNCRNHSTKNIGIDLLTLKEDNTYVFQIYKRVVHNYEKIGTNNKGI